MADKRPILKVAHRGASAYEIENTMSAFRRAIELGADMIELDVHVSRDGVPVVIHDFWLGRLTNGRCWVRFKTLAQLKALTIRGGEKIPTLEEVIDLVAGKCGLYIDLKGKGSARPTMELLRRKNFVDVIVGSKNKALLRDAKRFGPEFPRSYLTGQVEADHVKLARSAGAQFIHLCWESKHPQPHKLMTPALIARLRAAQVGIVLWHEERPEEIRELLKLDVDAICSNAPDLLIVQD